MFREALALLLIGGFQFVVARPATVGEYIAKARAGYVAESLR